MRSSPPLRCLFLVALAALVGCGADKTCDEQLAPVGPTLLAEGIAGVALTESNIGLGCSGGAESLAVYAATARVATEQEARALAQSVTPQLFRIDRRHETALAAGEYLVCSGLCSPLTVAPGKVTTVHAVRRKSGLSVVVYDAQGQVEPTYSL